MGVLCIQPRFFLKVAKSAHVHTELDISGVVLGLKPVQELWHAACAD